MEMKMTSIAVDHVRPVQHAMMVFRIKMKMASIAVDHVLLSAKLAMMEFKIKMKMASIAEEHAQLVVRKQYNSCRSRSEKQINRFKVCSTDQKLH